MPSNAYPPNICMGLSSGQRGVFAVVHIEQGRRQVIMTKFGKLMLTVDFNHPFAGKALTFKLDIVDVRDATGEESANGLHVVLVGIRTRI